MKRVNRKRLFTALLMSLSLSACGGNSDNTPKTYDMTGFARGADVSWLTEMENSGLRFYNTNGTQTECFTLLRDLGVNAIRLRVWVNPSDGWCNKQDFINKAVRANKLGFRIMVDFHYSDTWADPGSQMKPTAWKGKTLTELKQAIADHTTDILSSLKSNNITPEWIQIGNEVRSGLLWDTDVTTSGATWDAVKDNVTYKTNIDNFAAFLNVGSHAARQIFPSAKIIIHIDKGENANYIKWLGDILENKSVDYDVFGLSLYPDADWTNTVTSCIANLKTIYSSYGKEVMICEVGMAESPATTAKACLISLMSQAKALDYCLGVFYWEPETYGTWKSYGKGAFDASGKPTVAMDAFAK